MLNKRKAMIGYGVYTLAKPIAKAKLRVKPEPPKRSKKLIGGIAAATAAAGAAIGGVILWRKRRGSGESTG